MRFLRGGARRHAFLAALVGLALLATACGGSGGGDTDADTQVGDGGEATEQSVERGEVVVGSTNFDEQEIVASMYAAVLEQAGYSVERRFQLGAREVVLPALENGDIDLYPEYVGTALEFLNGGAGEATPDTEETTEKLREEFAERGVEVLEPAPAQDKNGLVVTPETAQENDLETVSDLEPVAGDLVFGGPPECPERPLCLQGYEKVYGLEFAEFRPLDAGGPVTTAALENGDIDVALMFTTDGLIAEKDWILLEEDKDLQPAENIVPVIREDVVNDEITQLLDEVSAQLTTEEVTELVRRVRVDAEDPADVAEDWLSTNGFLEG
ncbi:MAG TPA: ABC transporter substrate-binding protein [Egibacteraceae bacterium]|nr:ABC transporter substrate-binding protein [Egibacteraceae bacterium]